MALSVVEVPHVGLSGLEEVALSVVEVPQLVTENVGRVFGTAALHFQGSGLRLSPETGYRDEGFPCLHVQASGKAMTASHILASSWRLITGLCRGGAGSAPGYSVWDMCWSEWLTVSFRVGYVLVRVALPVSFHQCMSLTVCNVSSCRRR